MLYKEKMILCFHQFFGISIINFGINYFLEQLFLKIPSFLVIFYTQVLNLYYFVHSAKIQITAALYFIYLLGLFTITNAAITPGTHPHSQSKNVIKTDPQPLSKTAKGGQIIESITLQILILNIID